MKVNDLLDMYNLYTSVEEIGLRVTVILMSSSTLRHFETHWAMAVGFNIVKGKLLYDIWNARVVIDDSLPDMEVVVNKTTPWHVSKTITLYNPREC